MAKKPGKSKSVTGTAWKYIVSSPDGLIFNMLDVRNTLEQHGFTVTDVTDKLGKNDWIYEVRVNVLPENRILLNRVESIIDRAISRMDIDLHRKKSVIVQTSQKGDELIFIIEDGVAFLIDEDRDALDAGDI